MSVFRMSRYSLLRNGKHSNTLAYFSDDSSNKDKESPSSDKKESKTKEENHTKKLTSKRLDDLLTMMSNDSNASIVKSIAKPKSSLEKKGRRMPQIDSEKEDLESDNIVEAARKVAETLGGDAKKTQSELLSVVLKNNDNGVDLNLSSVIDEESPSSDKTINSDKKEIKSEEENNLKELKSKRLNNLLTMMSAGSDLNIVKSIVKPKSSLEKNERRMPQIVVNEKEDLESDNIVEATRKTTKESKLELSSLLDSMNIEKTESTPFERRSDFVRKSLSQDPRQRSQRLSELRQKEDFKRQFIRHEKDIQHAKTFGGSVDLFGGKPLGIFTTVNDLQDSPDILSTWNYLHQRESKMAVTHPPKNHFEKMAMWTDQGKLWKFPIDNEQGLDDEAKNYFVFLDKHLESWCPPKGPIRHFMELVCVGLSKNPYYTVAQKREHIEWFRDYFAEKKELLDSVIVDAKAPKELEK